MKLNVFKVLAFILIASPAISHASDAQPHAKCWVRLGLNGQQQLLAYDSEFAKTRSDSEVNFWYPMTLTVENSGSSAKINVKYVRASNLFKIDVNGVKLPYGTYSTADSELSILAIRPEQMARTIDGKIVTRDSILVSYFSASLNVPVSIVCDVLN